MSGGIWTLWDCISTWSRPVRTSENGYRSTCFLFGSDSHVLRYWVSRVQVLWSPFPKKAAASGPASPLGTAVPDVFAVRSPPRGRAMAALRRRRHTRAAVSVCG